VKTQDTYVDSLDDPIAKLKAASITYRVALGKNKGKKVLTLKSFQPTDGNEFPKHLCYNHLGFSVHAGTRCASKQ